MATTKIMPPQRNPPMSDGRGGSDLEERCKAYRIQLQRYEAEFQRDRQDMSDIKANMQTLERAKESFRHQLTESKRDNDRLTERLTLVTNDKKELERKLEQLNLYIAQLQADKGVAMDSKLLNQAALQDKQSVGLQQLVDRLRDENSVLKKEKEELQETVRRRQVNRAEKEKSPHGDRGLSQSSAEDLSSGQRRNHTPNHTVFPAKFSQGSLEEEGGAPPTGSLGEIDFSGSQSRSGHSHSSGSGPSHSYRKLSYSTNNLYGDTAGSQEGRSQEGRGYHTKLSEQTSRAQGREGREGSERKLEELSQQRLDLLSQVSSLEQLRDELEAKVKMLRQSLDSKEEHILKTTNELQECKAQMEVLIKQKGVALRENSASYEQMMKLQTSLQTIQVEKEILQAQHNAAVGERDKMVAEYVGLKKKMDSVLLQRQKDAKDLSSMKLLKDKAVQEVGELRRAVEELQRERQTIEGEMGVVKDHLRSTIKALVPSMASSESVVRDVEAVVGRLVAAESEKRALLKAVCGHDNIGYSEAIRKVEKLVSERDGFLEEIDELQHSASKEAEDRILELKHRIEDLMMEKDRFMGQCKTLTKENGVLNSKLSKSDEERERLRDDIRTLTEQCSSLESAKNRLVEEQAKTLERADKLWKQRPISWDDAWEEKQVEFAMGPNGLAGFSVAGGRDQPQLPNPGAILVTMVTKGSPADGQLKIGDVLEVVNGVNLSCADHRDAVRAVKESQGILRMVVKRRKHASTIQIGITSVINGLEPRVEEQEFSLMVKKDAIGFKYDWSSVYTVTEVTQGGPADQILKPGDKITKVNNTPITKEKPSAVKKLMKPHHAILKLQIQREACPDEPRPQTVKMQPPPNQMQRPPSNSTSRGRGLSGSSNGSWKNDKDTDKEEDSPYSDNDCSYVESQSPERHSRSGKPHSDDHSQTSEDSSRPTKLAANNNKLVAKVTRVRQGSGNQQTRSSDVDGEEEGGGDDYNERRIEYGDVLLSEATGSQVYDSYLSEGCSYDAYPSSTSQSIDLTFHSAAPAVSHNRLTVDTMTATCPQDPPSQPSSDDETSLSRNHKTRTTCIRKSSFGGAAKEDPKGVATQDSTPKHQPRKVRNRSKSKSIHGSMSQVSELTPVKRGRSRSSSSLNHGRSWSNLTHACSMTSVREEDSRRSTSSTNVSEAQEQDPLTGATYIRANFTYVPRNPKEMSVKPGNVFHIHDEEPSERFRASFWVSRLNPDGTDAQVGPIPNSTRAQQYMEAQGETIEVPLYEEVEPFNQPRPVMIFGALADQVVSHLLESYPNIFYQCVFEIIEAMGPTPGRLTEVRLNRELGEGKIIDFRRTDSGNSFAVLRKQALVSKEHKGQHCLLLGSTQALYQLKDVAPPISIFIKVISQDSISTFTTKPITPQHAADTYKEILSMINEPELSNEFSATILLTHMDTLVQQIEEVLKKEKQKQTWIVARKEC